MTSNGSEHTDLKRLATSVDTMMEMLQSISAKRDDQSILLNSLTGQLTVQGERIRQIEVDMSHVKGHITDSEGRSQSHRSNVVKDKLLIDDKMDATLLRQVVREEMRLALKDLAKDEIKKSFKEMSVDIRKCMKEFNDISANKVDDHSGIISKIQDVEDTVMSGVQKVDTAVNEIRVSVGQQRNMVLGVQRASLVIDDKVSRLTKIVALVNTKLKDELVASNNSIIDAASEIGDLKSDVNGKLSDVVDIVDKVDQKLPPPGQLLLNDDITAKMTAFAGNMTTKLTEKTDAILQESQKQATVLKRIEHGVEKTLSDKIDDCQREVRLQAYSIVDQIVAESQVIRSKNTPRPESKYICDFQILLFDELIASSRVANSKVWYINQLDMYVKGHAEFESNGSISISLVHGCYPKIVGLQANKIGTLFFKVKVLDQRNTQKDLDLGEAVFNFDEENIDNDCDGIVDVCGKKINSVSCKKIQKSGLDYCNKIVLRYEITVL